MPASGRFLLDANIMIALLEGDDAALSNHRGPSHLVAAKNCFLLTRAMRMMLARVPFGSACEL